LEIEMEIRSKVPSIERAPHSFSLSKPDIRRWMKGGRILRRWQQK
jgi:hypothetical protein